LRPCWGNWERWAPLLAAGVGADDPLLAFADAIREHLLIGLRREDRSGWQERGLLDELVERFEIPMTVFALSRT
jgi:hypothetical protein